jgi:hypothetical protein
LQSLIAAEKVRCFVFQKEIKEIKVELPYIGNPDIPSSRSSIGQVEVERRAKGRNQAYHPLITQSLTFIPPLSKFGL